MYNFDNSIFDNKDVIDKLHQSSTNIKPIILKIYGKIAQT